MKNTEIREIEAIENGNYISFKYKNGSDILSLTKDKWVDTYIPRLYAALIMVENKNTATHRQDVYFYNFLCKYFKIKTI